MKNWQALGEPAKASVARVWMIVTLLAIVGTSLAAALLPNAKILDGISRIIGFILLVSWYFSSGRGQAEYVKSRYGADYPRRGWGKPLVLALLALVAFIVVFGVVGLVATAPKRGA